MKQTLNKGFTLVEMLAVIAMMSIIMGFGIYIFGGMKSSAIGTGARQVYATLNLARQFAITQRTYVAVIISANYNGYAVMTNNGTSWVNIGRWEYLPAQTTFTNNFTPSGGGTVPPDTSSTGLPGCPTAYRGYIIFTPTGAARQQYGVVITDGKTTKNYAYITTDDLLGTIRIQYPQ